MKKNVNRPKNAGTKPKVDEAVMPAVNEVVEAAAEEAVKAAIEEPEGLSGTRMKFYAFISYKHYSRLAPWAKQDELWANKIHKYLETWLIPSKLSHDLLINPDDKKIKPVFQDSKQMYSGDDVGKILRAALEQSKCLVVVCSEKLIADQRALLAKGERAYIFEEIDYMKKLGRRIIVVWIDPTPFDKTSKRCVPDDFLGGDLKVIEVNQIKKEHRFHIKRRTTAEVAASIFQVNLEVFWDIYERQRFRMALFTAVILTAALVVMGWLNRERNLNEAFRLAGDARVELMRGNRKEAGKLAVRAYELYKGMDGLSLLMQQCMDETLPKLSFNGGVDVNVEKGLYAAVKEHRWVNVYRLKDDSLVASFDGYVADEVVLSPDGKKVAGYNGKFLRVFDVESKGQTPLLEISEDYMEFQYVDFNASGTLLLTQRDHCNAWAVYEVGGKQRKLFQDAIYTDDTVHWYGKKASFVGTDSLLLVYGKVSDKKLKPFAQGRELEGAPWKCCLYDLRKKDPLHPDCPAFREEIEVPEQTERIAAARNSFRIVMAGPEKVKVFVGKGVHDWTSYWVKYGSKIDTYTKEGLARYQKMYPDTWDKNKIVEVFFSQNEEYVMLVDQTNVCYVKSFKRPSQLSFGWNGISATETDFGTNKKYKAIGVTDDGKPIWFLKNRVYNQNIYWGNPEMLQPDGFLLPQEEGERNMRAFQTREGFLLLKSKGFLDQSRYGTDCKYDYRTYFFKKENRGGFEYLNPRDRKDTVEVARSPSEKYKIVRTRLWGKSKYFLWNRDTRQWTGILDEWLHGTGKLDFNASFYFVPGQEDILVCDYMASKKGGKVWSSVQAVFDIPTKKFLLERGMVDLNVHQPQVLLYRTEDSTFVYNVKERKIMERLKGEFRISNHRKNEQNMLIEKLVPVSSQQRKILGNWVYEPQNGKLVELPDSLKNRVYAASPAGKYLLVSRNEFAAPTAVLRADSYEVVYRIPELTASSSPELLTFTPDDKALMYREDRGLKITVVDLESGKVKYELPFYANIGEYIYGGKGLEIGPEYSGFALSDTYMALASNGVSIVDWRTGKRVHHFDVPLSERSEFYFSPSGRYLLAENHLLDLEEMECVCSSMPLCPTWVSDKGIYYENAMYHFYSPKELYDKLYYW